MGRSEKLTTTYICAHQRNETCFLLLGFPFRIENKYVVVNLKTKFKKWDLGSFIALII